VLGAIEPGAIAVLHPGEIKRLGLVAGRPVAVSTRRGAITATLRADRDVSPGMVFVPFAFAEGAANVLTNPALDPFGKIPEFKLCAAQVGKVPEAAE
jgi:formate dehydrogenase major subunit